MFRNYEYDTLTGRATFEIHDVDLSIVNAIRRIIQSEVQTVGFLGEPADESTIKVHSNNGPLHNEFISHRVGLIPIQFPEEEIHAYEDGSLRIELDVHHDKTGGMRNVTTHDFIAFRNDTQVPTKDLVKMFPVNHITKDPVLITKLRTGEHLHLTASAIKNAGKKHASFSPVSLCTFFYKQDDATAASLEKNDILSQERAYIKNEFGDPTVFVFSLESESGISPKYLIAESLEILMKKLDDARSNIINRVDEDSTENGQPASVSITKKDDVENTFEILFRNEDDTLGAFLQSLLHTDYVRRKMAIGDRSLMYAGYFCPHPLDPSMILRISFQQETTTSVKECEEFLKAAMQRMHTLLNEISNAWKVFMQNGQK